MIRARVKASLQSRSTIWLAKLEARIPHEIPARRDFTWFEIRWITPAILAGRHSPDLLSKLTVGAGVCPPRTAILKGILVSGDSALNTPEGLQAVADAVIAIPFLMLNFSAARRELLSACERVEWGTLPVEKAVRAARKAFRLRRSIALWRRLLGELRRVSEPGEICDEARKRVMFRRRVRRLLRSQGQASEIDVILAAELIALARCESGDTGRELARCWLLPLVGLATGRYLERTSAARRLSEQLENPGHVAPRELAEAMERGIVPDSWDDYSKFRKAFSEATWERLHEALSDQNIFTELERFACERDCFRFWRHIESKGERQ